MPSSRPPVVLIIDDQEWTARSLESILAPNGFAVMRAYTGAKGLERAMQHAPDAIIVDAKLPDMSGHEICRQLRQVSHLGSRTPIVVSSSERPTRAERLRAFESGAWDFVVSPVDGEEFVLRLRRYTEAKFEADRIREEGLVDGATGLYNLKGLERRVQEVRSWAYREQSAMACIVVSPTTPVDDRRQAQEIARTIADTLKETGRISDVIGRLGKSEFAVIAPSTDAAGAVRLAERLNQALGIDSLVEGAQTRPGLQIGYDAVANVRETPGEAQDLLMRATMALRRSRTSGNGWLAAYRETQA